MRDKRSNKSEGKKEKRGLRATLRKILRLDQRNERRRSTRVELPPRIKTQPLTNLYEAAFTRGYADGKMGKAITMNPYDHKRCGGTILFNRGNVLAWKAGWQIGHKKYLELRNRKNDDSNYI